MEFGAGGSDKSNKAGLTVLVIDDNLGVRKAIAVVLRQAGMRIFEAASGVQALTLAGTIDPDVIVCDLKMAEMNGTQTLSMLRQSDTCASAPVVLVSGLPKHEVLAAVQELNAVSCVLKPFVFSELIQRVLEAAGSPTISQ